MLLIAVLLIILLASIIYSFSPSQIDVNAYKTGSTAFHPSNNTNALPKIELSLIKCGRMMSKQIFVYRGGVSDWIAHKQPVIR